jgi:hypothetical protein
MIGKILVSKAVDYLVKKARNVLKEDDTKQKELIEELDDLAKRLEKLVDKLEHSNVKKKPGFFS